MERILVATDLSATATAAVARGDRLARSTGSRTTVVCVADPSAGERTLDATRHQLQRQLDELGIDAATEVRLGHPVAEILRAATETDADLIVIGAQGWHPRTERILGTTADRIIRRGDRPVLVVRNEPTAASYSRVLVGTDLSPDAAEAFRFSRSAFPRAAIGVAHVCAVVGEHILTMHGVSEDELDTMRGAAVAAGQVALDAWLEAQRLEPDDTTTAPGDPSTGLVALAQQRGDDLVVVGSHGMSGARFLLLGSVAQKVLRDAATDVLVVRSGVTDPSPDDQHRDER